MVAVAGQPGYLHYVATKGAVLSMTKGLAKECGAANVRVNVIAPGFVTTSLNKDIASWKPMAMDDTRAARIIRRGLDRGKPVITFPKLLAWGTRALDLIPAAWADWGLRRASVDIPETTEKPRFWRA